MTSIWVIKRSLEAGGDMFFFPKNRPSKGFSWKWMDLQIRKIRKKATGRKTCPFRTGPRLLGTARRQTPGPVPVSPVLVKSFQGSQPPRGFVGKKNRVIFVISQKKTGERKHKIIGFQLWSDIMISWRRWWELLKTKRFGVLCSLGSRSFAQ